jgi:glycosyltransferase involved in cell wall biosynthesis
MRVAWLGPAPTEAGGVPYMSGVLLRGLADAGHSVHAFVAGRENVVPSLREIDGLQFCFAPSSWEYDRWYSRTDVTKHVTGTASRLLLMRKLGDMIVANHAAAPFDVVYQFSTPELFSIRRHVQALPPIVVHPETHAAGELYWLRRERKLPTGESVARKAASAVALAARSAVQRHDLALATRIIAPSSRFADLVASDYAIPRDRFAVVPNPIDIRRFRPSTPSRRQSERHEILVVSRLAVRKGLEMIVSLSHRVADLADKAHITIIGERSLWSDYRGLLDGLNTGTAHWEGQLHADALAKRMQASSGLLQPSHYEPFALTVAEALASGVPVIASSEVGASEFVNRDAVRVHRPGDVQSLEREFRGLITAMDDPATAAALRKNARSEAERAFSPETVAGLIGGALDV